MNKASFLSVGGLLGLTFFSGFILSSFRVSAEEVHVSNVSVAVPVSCELSGTNTSHSADVNNGTYREDIGKTTLTVFCNDGNGFAIYAAGYTGNEIGGTDSTKLIGVNSNLKISTGTYTQGTTVDSVWAMKLTKVTDTSVSYLPNNLTIENGFSSYSAVPSSYTKVASYASNTDFTLGSKLETTYAAYISGSQRTDTYEGKVIYTIVHPASATTPVACSPTANTIAKATCLQDFATGDRNAIVNSMALEQQYTLKDKRDGKIYTVAKFADGNVWMTQNLDLDLNPNTTYTNLDTDIGYNTSTGQYETASWTPIMDDSAWDAYVMAPTFYDPGNYYWNGITENGNLDYTAYDTSCNGGFENCDLSLLPTLSSTGIPQHHLGNYYTYVAALAMNEINNYTEFESSIQQSICPTGWRLPHSSSDDNGEYGALASEYGFTSSTSSGNDAVWDAPLYFIPSGYRYNSMDGLTRIARIGAFWTDPSFIGYNGVAIGYDIGWNGSYGTMRYYELMASNIGSSVRCIAR